MDKIISFPIMGNYNIPAYYYFSKITNCKVIKTPKITSKTIELGSKYSPDFVCTPFKYTLGSFIECLDKGSNTLIQMGGGCRYGYYFELQEQILKDLGYDFKYYNLVSKGHTDLYKIYRIIKEIDKNIKIRKVIYYLLITKKMIKYMDNIEDYIRLNKAYEIKNGSLDKIYNEMVNNFIKVNSIYKLNKTYREYKRRILNVKLNKPKDNIRIAIIGELFTLMEPFANYNIEDYLINLGASVKRFTNVTYLLFEKKKKSNQYLKKLKNIKFKMGADAMDNIYYTQYLINHHYDGIIHIKSSFCTPEIGSMSVIKKMCEENDMPVLFMSMDVTTSKVGIETRLEAFYDMIEMRKRNE